jgi:hypothetical protein
MSDDFASMFAGTTEDTFAANEPSKVSISDRLNWISRDIPLLNPTEKVKQRVRLIPHPKLGYFAKPTRNHFKLGAEKNSLCCPKLKGPEYPCPVCAHVRELYKQADEYGEGTAEYEALRSLAGGMRAQSRHVAWVIDRGDIDKGPQLWAFSESTLQTIRSQFKDPDTGANVQLDNIRAGFDLYFEKKKQAGKTMATIEDIRASREETPLGTPDQIEKWLKFIVDHPVEDHFVFASPEQMEAMLKGGSGGGGSENETVPDEGYIAPAATQQAAPSLTMEQQMAELKKQASPDELRAAKLAEDAEKSFPKQQTGSPDPAASSAQNVNAGSANATVTTTPSPSDVPPHQDSDRMAALMSRLKRHEST